MSPPQPLPAATSTPDSSVPAWLRGLPRPPEYRPTESEFADPMTDGHLFNNISLGGRVGNMPWSAAPAEPLCDAAAAVVAVRRGMETPLTAVAEAFEELARGMEAGGGELRLAPFDETCALVSVLFSCLSIAFKFAEIEYVAKAERASQRRDVFHTNFLTPPIIKEATLVIEKLADIKAGAQGGYPQAERCRISVGHPDSMTSNPDVVAALSIQISDWNPVLMVTFSVLFLGPE